MMMACLADLLLGQADQAITTCEKAAPLEPNPLVQVFLAAAYANRGDLEKANAAKARALRRPARVYGFTITRQAIFGRSPIR